MTFSIKKLLPHTLFGRSLLIIAIPALLVQLITTFIFYDRHWDRMRDRMAFALIGEVSIILEKLETARYADEVEETAMLAQKYLNLTVTKTDLTALPESRIEGWRARLVAQSFVPSLTRQTQIPFTIQVSGNDKWVHLYFDQGAQIIRISVPESRLFSSSSYIVVLWMIAVSLILFGIAIIFMRNQIRPIRKLAVAADWFGKGRDVTQFKPEGAKEVRQAAHAFLTMRERIKRQISQRMEMLAGVSHDLRTPLTRLKLELAMLDDTATQAMRQDLEDMEEMIEGYLDFARGEGQEEPELMTIQDILQKIAGDARRQNITLELDIQTGVPVGMWLRVNAMQRCLMNLVTNAHSHADLIRLSFTADFDAQQAMITVEDNGPGIPPEKYEEVFRPFMRLEGSRNRKTGGVGLGLSIAQDIIHSHGGLIALGKSKDLGGLAVIVTLPL